MNGNSGVPPNSDDHAWGGMGDDLIDGEDGDDELVGDDGDDVVLGGARLTFRKSRLWGDGDNPSKPTNDKAWRVAA